MPVDGGRTYERRGRDGADRRVRPEVLGQGDEAVGGNVRIAGERRKGVPVLLAVGAVDGEDVGGAHGGLDRGGSDTTLVGEGDRDLGPDEESADLEQVDVRAFAIGGLRAGTQRLDKVLAERDPGGNGVGVDARCICPGGKQCLDVQGFPDRVGCWSGK